MSPFRIRYRVLTLKVWAFFVFRHGILTILKEMRRELRRAGAQTAATVCGSNAKAVIMGPRGSKRPCDGLRRRLEPRDRAEEAARQQPRRSAAAQFAMCGPGGPVSLAQKEF